MQDLGDLREGYYNTAELINTALWIEEDCKALNLKGIGTNLGCYGSIVPDAENLGTLVQIARQIEASIGRPLDWVSGGSTTTLPLIHDGSIVSGINHVRIGDAIFLRDMELYYDYHFEGMHDDAIILEAEIVELKTKPSHPVGTITLDAFNNRPVYEDIGEHQRALLAVGRQDIGDMMKLLPEDEGIRLIGGSSDHTIIDVTNAEGSYQVGDILRFKLQYEHIFFASASIYVEKVFE